MSRPLRIEYPGAWYHVMNRGRRAEDIFFSPVDYELFLTILQETCVEWDLQVSAYCLMPNHYHLLIRTPSGNLSRCMRHINGIYTQRFNRAHELDGQLFRGRYKSVLVDSDSYLLEVMRYIHQNPLKAGITKNLVQFKWSSHTAYLSKTNKWQWITKDFLLYLLSEKKSRQRNEYIDFISQEESTEIERFYSLKNLPTILGSEDFKELIKEKFRHLQFKQEITESHSLGRSVEEILDVVCDYFEVCKESFFQARRGYENLPRDIAIYLTRIHCRETLAITGSYFGIKNYSTVSSVVARVKDRRKQDVVISEHLARLEEVLNQGQRQT